MARKVLVSLVSAETLPNVELIKEFKNDELKYLFISTEQMKAQLSWIIKTLNLINDNYNVIEVNAFDAEDIETKLREYKFDDDEIILNITGGTKLMSLIVNDFFKNTGATIYYVTGQNKQYLKVFPNRGKRKFVLSEKITLKEYLTAYGFDIKENKPYKTANDAENFLKYYTSTDFSILKPITNKLQKRRSNNNTLINSIDGLGNLLNDINFSHSSPDKITRYDVKYLTSDWFEEYVYFKVKNELNLDDDEIGTGYELEKNGVLNEIDVIFVYQHKLYIIECKTSFYRTDNIPVEKNGKKDYKPKEINLLAEIIYKSDALRSKFGLFANTSLFTIAPVKDENGDIFQHLEKHLQRAENNRIKIISKQDILSKTTIRELLKIN
ncbi:MAG: DUF1887 family protein [Bacteroidales bacterium]|nr:DUF1887 family protein [Bacteroidales bacterium]